MINWGPAKIPIQAVRAIPFKFSLTSFTNTCPRDHVKVPANNNNIPIIFPSKLGAPDNINKPINEIIIPIKF